MILARRQLRLVHVQPRALPRASSAPRWTVRRPGRARRRRSSRRTSSSPPAPAVRRSSWSSSCAARACRRSASASATRRSSQAFGGEIGERATAAPRQDERRRARRPGRLPRAAAGIRGRALPLARRDARARRARGLGAQRRRRGDGRAPPRAADRGRAVPSRVRPDAARQRPAAELPRRDPARRSRGCSRARPDAGRGARRDGLDHERRGDAGADGRLPRRVALQGRDRARDRRLRGGDARARARGEAEARRPRRHRRHRRRQRAHAQHLDRRGARRSSRRRGCREARQPRGVVELRLRRRARGARLLARASARADRAVDRRARLRLPLRAHAPPGDAARGAGAARARDANGLQRARPADESRGRAGAGRRRLLRRARADDRATCSRSSARGAPSSSTARAGSTSSRRPARTSSPRSCDGQVVERTIDPLELGIAALRSGGASRRHARGERGDDPPRLRRRRRRRAATRSCSTPPARSPRPGTPTTCARGSSWRGRRSRAAQRRSGSTRSLACLAGRMGRFSDALRAPGLGVIAEIKRRSPSAGDLRPRADPVELTVAFERAGAAAVSILVDERFGGSLADLKSARAASPDVPLLAKGFFTEELQLLQMKLAGADARSPAPPRPRRRARAAALLGYATELELDTLVEAHDAAELAARRRARRGGDRDQRARPVDLRGRPARAARARRAGAARPDRSSRSRASSRARKVPRPSSRAPTRCSWEAR